ncbi:MAG TPA: phosphoribosyltransferase family protein [Streptosporangiaceae bacterium]|nr:phosphoribosyltransferase family protein [Streptosporangiaceae bacterium]
MRFTDRADAGQRLARRLDYLRGGDLVVLGLPRGGVPVAFEVARALGAPLDVIVVRKLGVPFQPELAMGAIGEGGIRVTNDDVIRRSGVTEAELAAVEQRELKDLAHQARRFRAGRPHIDIAGRTVIVVDDGIATGSTASAACQVARRQGAATVIMAAPVGAPESIAILRTVCDEVVCLDAPPYFAAVGTWYDDFSHVPDADVTNLLERAANALSTAASSSRNYSRSLNSSASKAPGNTSQPARDEPVEVQAGPVVLAGHLTIPAGARGTVVFVHGSGSSRHSPRNRYVAGRLNEAGLGTLLFDLLTSREELDRVNVFDVETLASRLSEVTAWLRSQPGAADAPLGYFGASTGAAAALWAAAEPAAQVDAVVSRGGRPDLAEARLAAVRSPTLLIVGDRDEVALGLNREAQQWLRCENRLAVVPGATHLFEEPGALQTVTTLARDWFCTHFGASSASSGSPSRAAPPS